MNNPVNDMPSHPDFDGMTKDQIYEYIESSVDLISDEVYDIGNDIIFWQHQPMKVGDSFSRNIFVGPFPIGIFRQHGIHYRLGNRMVELGGLQHPGTSKTSGFRVVRNK